MGQNLSYYRMGQNLSCVDDSSCEAPGSVAPGPVFLPQEPKSVSDLAMQKLIDCINNYIHDSPCDLSTIKKLIRMTKRNPAGIIRHLKDSRYHPHPNRTAYAIVAHYTNLIDAFRDIQEEYHQKLARAVWSIPDVQRDIPQIHQEIERVLGEEMEKDQKTIDGLYGTHFKILDSLGATQPSTHGNYNWLHHQRYEPSRDSVNERSTWIIGYGNTQGGATPKKPRRKKKRTRRKKRSQRKKTTQRKKRTKSV